MLGVQLHWLVLLIRAVGLVEGLEEWVELVVVVDKQPVTASGISLGFLIGEVGVDLMKSLQQTLLFHKREKGHPLPGIFLSV